MMLSFVISILLTLLPAETGTVAGTVRMRDGKPASGVRVGLMIPPRAGRGEPIGAGTLEAQVLSDDAGKFQLDGVPPGPYYVVAGKPDSPTFYPGVREFAMAKTVDVRAKVTLTNINFDVDAIAQGRETPAPSPKDPKVIAVKGRVVLKGDVTGPPPAAMTFDVAAKSGRAAAIIAVASDKTFSLPLNLGDQSLALVDLPEGYTLISMISGTKDLRSQPLRVEAGAEVVVTLNADSRPRFRVIGRVIEDTTERSLAGEQVELVLPTGEIIRTIVNAQGMITFSRLFPGSYGLRLVSPRLEVSEKRIIITDSSVSVELRARDKR